MAQDLKGLMKMDSAALAELALKYNAPISSSMSKKELAREVYRAASVFESMHYQELLEEENVWVDSSGVEQTLLSGQSFLQMGDINKLLPSEVANDLLSSDSAASAFTYAYRNQQHVLHNEIMVTLRQSGVNPDDVYGQLSSEYRNSAYVPLSRELRNVLHTFQGYVSGDNGGQDISGGLAGYYGGNDESLLSEFSTPEQLGGVPIQQALGNIATAYINRTRYESEELYNDDIVKLSRRLQTNLGSSVQGIATQIALEKQAGKDTYTSYADILPSSLSDGRLSGISGARIPDKSLMPDVRMNMRGIAAIYGYGSAATNVAGKTGLGVPPRIDDRLSTVNELMLIHGDEPGFMAEGGRDAESALSVAIKDHEFSEDNFTPAVEAVTKKITSPDYRYAPDAGNTLNWSNDVGWRDPGYKSVDGSNPPAATPPAAGIKFYNVDQNSPEWDALRADHITASVAGSLLGNNKHSEPLAAIFQSVGFNPFGIENIHNQHFKRGHRLEEIGRAKYSAEFGHTVNQVGFVTNDLYPGLGVSPDGLVGDDGLVEFKAPAANRFFDPLSKPDYIDQVQMQMAVTGRKWADLTQVGSNYGSDGKEYQWLGRVDRIHADPKWVEQNAARLQNYGALIKEGRTLHSLMQNGSLAQEDFVKILTEAAEKDGASGVEYLQNKIPEITERARRTEAGWDGTEGNKGTFETRHDFDARDYRRKGSRAAPGFEVSVPHQDSYDHHTTNNGGHNGGGSGNGGNVPPNWGNGDADFDDEQDPRSWAKDWDFGKSKFGKDAEDRWSKLAEAVKKGVTEAEEEKERKREQRKQAVSGTVSSLAEGAGSALDSLLSIPAAGSVGGAKNALEMAIGRIPGAGKFIAAGIGAMGVAADAVDIMGEEVGFGEEAGIFNPYMWMGNKQNFEALGMNEHQAFAAATTFGNATAQLNFGNPGMAARLLTDFRGLVGLEDLRNMKDPSAFAKLIIERGKARGYSNQQMSGMFSAAGMPELSRALTASDSTWDDVHERSGRAGAKTGEEIDNVFGLNSKLKDARAKLNPSYNAKGLVLDEAGEGKLDSLAGFVDHISPSDGAHFKSLQDKIDHDFPIPEWQRKLTEAPDLPKALFALSGVESGHGSNTVNPKSTATGQYQVLAGKNKNGTLYNPSFSGYDKVFNIQGAKDDSESEKDRVASEYLKANIQDEGGLYAGVLAYHIGPGAMHNLRKRFGDDWNKHLTSEQADYLQKFKENFEAQYGDMIKGQEVFSKRNTLNNYAARMNNNSREKVDINVDVNIKGNTANTVVAMNNRAVKQKTTNLNPGGQMHTVLS